MMTAGSSVLWRSKQQRVVAQSSMEAELVSQTGCLKEVLWVKKFSNIIAKVLDKLTVESLFSIVIGEDNQACISNAKTVVITGYTKHIDLKFRFLVDHIEKRSVGLEYLLTDQMATDILTKNLTSQKFKRLLELLEMK